MTIVPCPALNANLYGTFNLESCRTGEAIPNTRCEFQCYDGYTMEGNNVWNCMESTSTWDTSDLPTCHGDYVHYL